MNSGKIACLNILSTSVLGVAAVAAIYLMVQGAEPRQKEPRQSPEEPPLRVQEGEDYRVLVVVARIKPNDVDGKAWDSGAESARAPDAYYEILWRGQIVYTSQVVDNALVASWSAAELPDLYNVLAGTKISLESVSQGALITARRGDRFTIRVADTDALKTSLIETLEIPVDNLVIGEQTVEGRRGLESLTLRVVPRGDEPWKHLLQ